MSENELQELKEQIKKELLVEMNTKQKNQNLWQKLKDEYKEEFEEFNYVRHWECMNCNNELITRDDEVNVSYPMQTAIGTLLRITYKAKTVKEIDVSYKEIKDTVNKILNVLKEKAGV